MEHRKVSVIKKKKKGKPKSRMGSSGLGTWPLDTMDARLVPHALVTSGGQDADGPAKGVTQSASSQ